MRNPEDNAVELLGKIRHGLKPPPGDYLPFANFECNMVDVAQFPRGLAPHRFPAAMQEVELFEEVVSR